MQEIQKEKKSLNCDNVIKINFQWAIKQQFQFVITFFYHKSLVFLTKPWWHLHLVSNSTHAINLTFSNCNNSSPNKVHIKNRPQFHICSTVCALQLTYQLMFISIEHHHSWQKKWSSTKFLIFLLVLNNQIFRWVNWILQNINNNNNNQS